MAPRRNNSITHSGVDVQNLINFVVGHGILNNNNNNNNNNDQNYNHHENDQILENLLTSSSSPPTATLGNLVVNTNSSNSIFHQLHIATMNSTAMTTSAANPVTGAGGNGHGTSSNGNENYVRCCVPSGECLKSNSIEYGLINLDDLTECIRVVCNNDNCSVGQYMHRECFEQWEQGVLNTLKTIGRARSWTDRQRAQNLWTKKGYDLIYKSCGCKCGRGYLKKDLDWVPPLSNDLSHLDDEANKKKKKRNRNHQKPTLAISTINSNSYHPNSQLMNGGSLMLNGNNTTNGNSTNGHESRARAGSLSSNNGSPSPPASTTSDHCISPIYSGTIGDKKHLVHQFHHQKHNKAKVEIYSERVRSTSGCNGIFSRRLDFSSFNLLPPTRLNSYQVKMEDEGNHGNDDTRLFILSSLAQNHKSRVLCVLCSDPMLVFDRYPLVDGTFFLSPKQHSPDCIEVKHEGRVQYLSAVCMPCLDGETPDRMNHCRFCKTKWDGSSLVLGTMYSYDVFAAMPCCIERLKCNSCYKLVLYPQQRLNFFSDYSQVVSCPYCNIQDTHFVKPLSYCYDQVLQRRQQSFQQWP